MVITPRRFRNVDILLNELCRLTYFKDLPLGVRYLFSLETGVRIDNLDQLIDGKSYVCSSHSRLKKISYGGKPPLAHWGSRQHFDLPDVHGQRMANNETKRRPLAVKTTEHSRQRGYSDPKSSINPSEGRVNMKPKIVTVIRNGPHKPRTVVKTLLNKRTAQKLEQVLDEVSNSIGNTGGLTPPRKLYTVTGQHVRDVADLFLDENNIFIAVGSEKFHPDEIADILEDLEQNTSSKKHSKRKQSKSGNEGMSHNKQKRDKDGEQIQAISTIEESKLPKLPDIHAKAENKPKQEISNKPHVQANSNAKRSHVGHHGRTKHSHTRSPDKKHHNAVKLPQIGNNNLVAKPAKGNEENADISEPSNQENDHVLGVQHANDELNETENVNNGHPGAEKPNRKDSVHRRESVSKKHSVSSKDKVHKKTSRDDSGIISEDEVKYGTVTDKSVEDVYHMGKKIGDGNFADVRECIDKITKKEFALKIVDKSKIRGKEQMIRDEIDIMRRCKHPNIVRMYEDYDTTRHIYLVMELIKGGDLFDAISSSVKFSEDVTRNYVKDIGKSLAYLHKRKIVHRDLKPENLLVSQVLQHKVAYPGCWSRFETTPRENFWYPEKS